jgi:hypothetical protein
MWEFIALVAAFGVAVFILAYQMGQDVGSERAYVKMHRTLTRCPDCRMKRQDGIQSVRSTVRRDNAVRS